MPTRVMDQSSLSPFLRNPEASSLLAEEPFSSTERQVGFMKSDPRPDDYGARKETLMISSNYSVSSPLGTHNILGAHSLESLGHCEQKIQKDQKAMLILERQLEPENSTHISTISKEANDCDSAIQPDLLSPSASSIVKLKDQSRSLYDNSFFSSSLSELFAKKLRLSSNNAAFYQSFDENKLNLGEEEPFESMEEIEAQTIGNLLPDDDDLLSGVIEDVGVAGQTNGGDDVDDIFYCGGGMELETNDNRNACKASECFGGGASNCGQGTLDSIFAGEHPFGEHPSRTLFVRNINSNVEDAELRHLFEKYGDIRTMYTACKHRGFVMISYYDIRAARNAMQELQNKPLKRRKLDIHFSIPKENPSEKDINQGILMILNLDSSVSNDDLRRSFGAYGEIKEIREIPHKRHHKFIEFYDVRAAEAALRALNSSSISGKTIKLEPSHPGAVKRCLMQQLSPELELEELNGWKLGSPSHSQSDSFGSLSLGMITSSGVENGAFQNRHSMVSGSTCAFMESTYHGISSTVPKNLAATVRFASSGGHNNAVALSELSHSLKHIKFGFRGMDSLHPHSLPEYNNGVTKGIPFKTLNPVSAINPRHEAGIDKRIVHRLGSDSRSNHHDNKGNSIGFSGNGGCPLHERSYIWKNSHARQHQPPSPVLWSNISSFTSNVPAHTPPQAHGRPRGASHMSSNVLPLHHVGSAHQINHSLWDRRHGYHGDSIDPHAFHSGSLGSMGFSNSTQLSPIELASRGMLSHSSGNCVDPSISPGFQISSAQQRSQIFHCRNPMIPMPGSLDGSADRIKCRRNETNSNQPDNKKQYELDIEQIVRGEDSRTTLMIKNIPNKYTSKMLLAAIDENHRGTYDFIYLPIDFKNKCNVGYAFINMTKPQHIVPFYQSFSGKKWEKFNSEKVASLAYARIQGKAALITHFQNSSLMNEDKRCRPILFHSDGPNAGDQEPFPIGVNIRSRSARSKTTNGREEQHQGSPTASASTEASGNSSGSPSGSTLDSE